MISQACIDLIKKWEGYEAEAYRCAAGVWTYGFGSIRKPDGTPVEEGDITDEDEAEALLWREVRMCEGRVLALTKDVTTAQLDALVSFCYNLGTGAFKASTLRRKHNEGDYEGAAAEFGKWIYVRVGGQKISKAGLVARRADERELYAS